MNYLMVLLDNQPHTGGGSDFVLDLTMTDTNDIGSSLVKGIVGSDEHNFLDDDSIVGSDEQNPLDGDGIVGSDEHNFLDDDSIVDSDEQNPLDGDGIVGSDEHNFLDDDSIVDSDEQNPLDSDGIVGSDEADTLLELEDTKITKSGAGIVKEAYKNIGNIAKRYGY